MVKATITAKEFKLYQRAWWHLANAVRVLQLLKDDTNTPVIRELQEMMYDIMTILNNKPIDNRGGK